ncbi:uncharacterized protein LOC108682077 [Hyalella azteca]|uniref:Uncharacterized protein LOC108682077 n=1 Tax=Hyalella azteca TaxID=294128 RepID=A0A8B7PKH3_HYAAZ|nr:uncharacterized protein LOC108682077 [Hyalella azteca]
MSYFKIIVLMLVSGIGAQHFGRSIHPQFRGPVFFPAPNNIARIPRTPSPLPNIFFQHRGHPHASAIAFGVSDGRGSPISFSNKDQLVGSNQRVPIVFGVNEGRPLPSLSTVMNRIPANNGGTIGAGINTFLPIIPPTDTIATNPSSPAQTTSVNATSDKCSLKFLLTMFEGSCSRLLTRSSCESDQWLLLSSDGVAHCAERRCPWEQLEFQGDCVDPATPDLCPRGQIIYVDINGQAECDCEANHYFDADSGQCFMLHEQGPCESSHYLEKGLDGKMECVPNPCENDELVSFEGTCYKKNYKGYCSPTLIEILAESNSADCLFTPPRSVFDVLALSACPEGSQRSFLGKCREVLRIPTQTTSPSFRGVCLPGFVSDQTGTCRRVVSIFSG